MGSKAYIIPKTAQCSNVMSDEEREKIESFYATASEAPPQDLPDHVVEECVKPSEDWMLVRLDLPMQKAGSVWIPETARPDPRVGLVISVGPGTAVAPVRGEDGQVIYFYPMFFRPGELVMIDAPTSGRVIPGNTRYKLFRQLNVCCSLSSNMFQEHGITEREDRVPPRSNQSPVYIPQRVVRK